MVHHSATMPEVELRVLGCSRCRFASGGCRTCRDPSYQPRASKKRSVKAAKKDDNTAAGGSFEPNCIASTARAAGRAAQAFTACTNVPAQCTQLHSTQPPSAEQHSLDEVKLLAEAADSGDVMAVDVDPPRTPAGKAGHAQPCTVARSINTTGTTPPISRLQQDSELQVASDVESHLQALLAQPGPSSALRKQAFMQQLTARMACRQRPTASLSDAERGMSSMGMTPTRSPAVSGCGSVVSSGHGDTAQEFAAALSARLALSPLTNTAAAATALADVSNPAAAPLGGAVGHKLSLHQRVRSGRVVAVMNTPSPTDLRTAAVPKSTASMSVPASAAGATAVTSMLGGGQLRMAALAVNENASAPAMASTIVVSNCSSKPSKRRRAHVSCPDTTAGTAGGDTATVIEAIVREAIVRDQQPARKRRKSSKQPSSKTAAAAAAQAAVGAAGEHVKSDLAGLMPDPRVCLWVPPASPYGLIEEMLYADPWRLLLACMLLNKTSGKQVRKVIWRLLALYPTPEALASSDVQIVQDLLQPLGLFRKRALSVRRFSHEYMHMEWTNPQQLHGIGQYAADAYNIFCRGLWQGPAPEDKDLKRYHEWINSTGGEGSGLQRESAEEVMAYYRSELGLAPISRKLLVSNSEAAGAPTDITSAADMGHSSQPAHDIGSLGVPLPIGPAQMADESAAAVSMTTDRVSAIAGDGAALVAEGMMQA